MHSILAKNTCLFGTGINKMSQVIHKNDFIFIQEAFNGTDSEAYQNIRVNLKVEIIRKP